MFILGLSALVAGGCYAAVKESAEDLTGQYGLGAQTVKYLMNKYGTRYRDVLDLTKKDKRLKEPICRCSPAIGAQVVYSIQVEMAVTPEDIIWRRLGLGYLSCPTKECETVIRKFLGAPSRV